MRAASFSPPCINVKQFFGTLCTFASTRALFNILRRGCDGIEAALVLLLGRVYFKWNYDICKTLNGLFLKYYPNITNYCMINFAASKVKIMNTHSSRQRSPLPLEWRPPNLEIGVLYRNVRRSRRFSFLLLCRRSISRQKIPTKMIKTLKKNEAVMLSRTFIGVRMSYNENSFFLLHFLKVRWSFYSFCFEISKLMSISSLVFGALWVLCYCIA